MPAEERLALATLQQDFIAALADGSVSESAGSESVHAFDADRLKATAGLLLKKRARSLSKAWPGIVRMLGPEFGPRFQAFAIQTPLPARGGPLADGRRFAELLLESGEASAELRLAMLAVDLHFVRRPAGLIPRRGAVIKAALLREPRRWAIGIKLPWGGHAMWIVPLSIRGLGWPR